MEVAGLVFLKMSKLNGDKKQQIMRVAERLFTTRRFHEITLDEVAQQAAVGKGTIYRHFVDKDDLFFQVALHGFEDLCQLIGRKTDDTGSFETQLVNVCEQIARFFARRRQWFQLVQAEAGRMQRWSCGDLRDRWMARRGELVSAVARVIDAGKAQGRIRLDLRSERLAHYLLGMLRTQAMELNASADESSQVPFNPPQSAARLNSQADSAVARHAAARAVRPDHRELVDMFLHGCAAAVMAEKDE